MEPSTLAPGPSASGRLSQDRREGSFLCRNCERFDIQSFSRAPYGLRGYNMKVTEDAASQGCPFCSLIIKTFRKGMPSKDWDRLNRQKLWFHMSMFEIDDWWATRPEGEGLGIGSLRVVLASITYGFPVSLTRTKSIETFHVVADLGDAAYASGDVRGTYVNENTESETYLHEIKWRSDKCFSHEVCCKTLSGNRQIDCRQVVLPTRCIDVLGPGLHIAETGCVTSSYLILSHRWTADTAACATTAGNIEQRRQGDANALLSLPKTFLDLFDLARGLGVRYIWIDSICIIQQGDGGQDWNQEAPRIGDYYQQAMLTVCATSGDKGLFQTRTYSKAVPDFARLPFQNREGARQGFFYVYPYNNQGQNMLLDEETIQGSELLTRGWVFQEWLLSRRLVYFTPAGMIYECVTTGMSDDRGEVWDSQKHVKAILPYMQEPFRKDFYSLWYRLVEIYSSKSLTCPVKDIIMALAGVAKEFGDAMMTRLPVTTVHCGLEYLSGLWAYDLHRGLLWERKVFNGQHRRLHSYPSWSWTSTIGTVVWDTKPVRTRPPSLLKRAWDGGEPDQRSILYPEAKFLAASTLEGNVLSFSGTPLTTAERFSRPPADTFSTVNKFAILRIEGKVARFVVREKFSEDEDMRPLFNLCGDAVDPKSAQTLWRKVCTMADRTEITGWSSIEHPSYQEEALYEGGLEVLALSLVTSCHDGGYGLGFYGLSGCGFYTVYHVLFLRELHGGRFERMGVGKLFGRDVSKAFHTADVIELELV